MQDKKMCILRKSNTAGVEREGGETALEQVSAAFQMLVSVAGLKSRSPSTGV